MNTPPKVNPHEDAGYWMEVKREQELDSACPECGGLPPHVSNVATGLSECECRAKVTIYYLARNGRERVELTYGDVTEVREGWDRRRGKLVRVRAGWHESEGWRGAEA